MRWFAAGNEAVGVVAVGNVATGVIAVGNVARGVIAIGNVAVGVVAAGNVGIGIVAGAGATIAVGAAAWGVVIVSSLWEGAAATSAFQATAIMPVIVWAALAVLMHQAPPPPDRPEPTPEVVPLERIRAGVVPDGWIRATLVGGGASVRLQAEGRELDVALPDGGREPRRAGTAVFARLRVEERTVPADGYRATPGLEVALTCLEVRPVPAPPRRRPWSTDREIVWWLARAFRAAAVAGAIAFLAGS